MKISSDWLKVLTVIVGVLSVLGPGLGYVIHQQNRIEDRQQDIKDKQRDMKAEIKSLNDRLEWSGIIPIGTRQPESTEDWGEVGQLLREIKEKREEKK